MMNDDVSDGMDEASVSAGVQDCLHVIGDKAARRAEKPRQFVTFLWNQRSKLNHITEIISPWFRAERRQASIDLAACCGHPVRFPPSP